MGPDGIFSGFFFPSFCPVFFLGGGAEGGPGAIIDLDSYKVWLGKECNCVVVFCPPLPLFFLGGGGAEGGPGAIIDQDSYKGWLGKEFNCVFSVGFLGRGMFLSIRMAIKFGWGKSLMALQIASRRQYFSL